jgi:hypothetical protein
LFGGRGPPPHTATDLCYLSDAASRAWALGKI